MGVGQLIIANMAAVGKSLLNLGALRQFKVFATTNATRGMAAWNKDWKPGPYPTTPEERAAAARKYGLRPDEYEPYPDDGLGLGDYPKLPNVSAEARNPFGNYDHPEHRRNFGEPLHADMDMYGLDRVDDTTKPRYSLQYQAACFFGVMTTFFIVYSLLDDPQRKMHWPKMPKQYPGEGKVHYTFEPAE